MGIKIQGISKCFASHMHMFSREATHTNFIDFDLIRLGFEPTFYCTQDEHSNQYITNVVIKEKSNLTLKKNTFIAEQNEP